MSNFVSAIKNNEFDFIFKVLYLILGLLTFNSITANSATLTLLSYLLTAIGGLCILCRLINYKKYMNTRGLFLLALFLMSYMLSSVYTFKYGVTENIKAIIWMGMQFLLLYAYDKNQTKEKIKKEATILGSVFIGYTFVFSVLSIGCLILNYYYYRIVNDIPTIIGFLWNRLWGFYSDPNRGAIYALISLLISAFAIYKTKRKSVRAFLVANIIIEIAYIGFSDSRTGLVSAIAGLIFSSVLGYYKSSNFERQKVFGKVVSSIIVVVGVVLSFVVVLKGAVLIGNSYMAAVHNPDSILYYWMDEEKRENGPGVEDELLEEDFVGRPIEDLGSEGGDVSNRRFAIWMSGTEVFLTSPVLGTSFRNIIPYAQEHLPNTYIVNNDFSPFSSMHNMFVDVLVSQGLLGMLIFITFMILVLYIIFKRLFKKNKEDYYWCLAFLSVIVPVFVSSFFYSEIVYINTANAVVFWIALGYLVNYIQKDIVEVGKNE